MSSSSRRPPRIRLRSEVDLVSRITNVTLIRRSLDHTDCPTQPEDHCASDSGSTHCVAPTTRKEDVLMESTIPNVQTASYCCCIISFMVRTLFFTSTIGCTSFQAGVTGFQMYLFARIFQHSVSRPLHCLISVCTCKQGVSRSHDCKKMFTSLSDVDLCVETNSTEAFATGVLCQSTQ